MANVDKNIVLLTDLSEQGFETITVGRKRTIVPRVSTSNDNRLQLTPEGLFVGNSATTSNVQMFVLPPTNNVRLQQNEDFRHMLTVKDGFACVHLDFLVTRSVSSAIPLFTIPNHAPLPTAPLEAMTHLGFPVWWSANERTIYCDQHATRNRRVIVSLVGFL